MHGDRMIRSTGVSLAQCVRPRHLTCLACTNKQVELYCASPEERGNHNDFIHLVWFENNSARCIKLHWLSLVGTSY